MPNRRSTYISLRDDEVAHFFRWYAQRAEGMNPGSLRVWWRDDERNHVCVYFEHNYPVIPNYVSPSVSSLPRQSSEGYAGK